MPQGIFQGILRKLEKEIIQKFWEFKEIWVKYKEIETNSMKTIPEALARVFHLSRSLLLKRTIKEHKIEENKIKFLKCSLAHTTILH